MLELINGRWQSVYPALPCRLGEKGVTSGKVEGDKKTPMGLYPITSAFGLYPCRLPFHHTEKDDVWVDDPRSPHYNTLQKKQIVEGFNCEGGFTSEPLYIPAYQRTLVVGYNQPPQKDLGSAIFIHTYTPGKKGTLGCIALCEEGMVFVYNWVNAEKNPHIFIAP